MSVAKVTGIETEYGIILHGAAVSDPFLASEMLLAECDEAGPLLHPASWTALSPYDLMLANGARFYIDHAHPEYSTAEAIDPLEVVAADKAGEVLLDRCRARVAKRGRLSEDATLCLYKNNSDQKGNSYGCHENYLVEAPAFVAILDAGQPGKVAVDHLIPFLVTRSVLCGAGKIGAENGEPSTPFQLTQRADFFETVVGLQTTYCRPLLNTRDEPHADFRRHRRLHMIVGDANLAEYSTYIKVGTTQLLLRLIEEGVALPSFTLDDPVAAAKIVSRDLTFGHKLSLRDGGHGTALDIQRELAAIAGRYLDGQGPRDPHHQVLSAWRDSLERLARDWRLLDRRFDWAIKRSVFERYLRRARSDWTAVQAWQPIIEASLDVHVEARAGGETVLASVRAQLGNGARDLEEQAHARGLAWANYCNQREIYFGLRRLDLEYHDIRSGDGAPGVFRRLDAAGAVERLIDSERVAALVESPPRNTRAYARGTCIRRYGASIRSVDWGEIEFVGPNGDHVHRVTMEDPTRATEDEVGTLLAAQSDQPWTVLAPHRDTRIP